MEKEAGKLDAIDILCKVADLAAADGIKPYKLSGTWKRKLDDQWSIRVNGGRTEKEGIPPYSMLVEYSGFPAGIIDPGGGVFAAHKERQGEFLKALDQAIKERGL